jgi:hypothetical protein
MVDLLVPQTLVQVLIVLIGAIATCLFATGYLRRVRLERPAVGTFNGRDVVVLFFFIVTLPVLYLVLPHWALTTFLVLTFVASLSIGYRPVLRPALLWTAIGLLIGVNIWVARTSLGTVGGWQFYWAETSLLVLLGASAVANLYVQGGMQLRHVAWFAGGLAIYDSMFTLVWPISNLLIREFVNHPLFPAMGMRLGYDEAIVGLGDLLVYAGFTIAAVKAYGRPGLRLALSLVLVFGAVMPTLSGLLFNYVDSRLDVVIPAQTWFGPAAVVGYLWLRRRYGRERTMKEYLASVDAQRRVAPSTPSIPGPRKIESEPVSA